MVRVASWALHLIKYTCVCHLLMSLYILSCFLFPISRHWKRFRGTFTLDSIPLKRFSVGVVSFGFFSYRKSACSRPPSFLPSFFPSFLRPLPSNQHFRLPSTLPSSYRAPWPFSPLPVPVRVPISTPAAIGRGGRQKRRLDREESCPHRYDHRNGGAPSVRTCAALCLYSSLFSRFVGLSTFPPPSAASPN